MTPVTYSVRPTQLNQKKITIMSFTILSFCGGGIRGLASVTMLNQLYQKYPNIILAANMLAGTSTGGGIIAALAAANETPQELIDFFWTSELDFYKNPNSDPTQPAYSTTEFASDMKKKYGTQTLGDITTHKMLFTSFWVGTTNPSDFWAPVLFHNFSIYGKPHTFLADAVVYTGAMPGMFGAYNGYVDGAFVNHDPTLAAIALAVNSGVNLTDIVVICFGTGFMGNSLGPETANWGAQQWQQGDSGSYNVPALLVNGSISPILNMSLSGTSTILAQILAGWLLPERYAYLNPTLDYFIPENDTDRTQLKYLQDQSINAVDYSTAEALVKNYWPSS
jgi:patatin-like phospholipase/acyl hydrolase